MKLTLLLTIFAICSNAMAQPPQGGGRGMGGGGREGRPTIRGQMKDSKQSEENFWVMHLPEIPDLTQDQRRKLINNLSKEQESLSKLMKEKRELEIEMDKAVDPSKKEMDNLIKKINKIDDKIIKSNSDYDKKYRKILAVEQYMVFKEKKKEIQFKRPRRDRGFPQPPGESEMPRPDFDGMTSRLPVFDAESGKIM